ncbi:MAG TPA: DUF2357 domain-containing protein [Candidatus Sulfotelmatobacter sp.]
MGAITTDKPELFVADYHDGRTGRFRPGLNVGELQIRFFVGGVPCGSASFEVLSKKISYLSDYQAMLKSIASYLAEIIAERFAPSEQDFSPLENRDAVTLYQQFAFLRSFLLSDEFQAAVRQIISTPDQHWTASDEQRPLSKGLRSTVGIMRALSCPGQRQANPGIGIDCLTLPLFVPGLTFIEDVDTPENRFVFHILQNWLALAILVRDRIRAGQSAREQRGIREAEEVIAALEQVLAANLFRKLGVLGFVPVGSTVLQRKEGYRELYRVFLQAQVAAQISWQGADDVYGAGKKNVALLYEYWVFLTLASIVSKLCGLKPLNVSSLIEKTPDGLGLKLRQDKRFALRGYAERNGKKMAITLFYNRSFKPSSNLNEGSWTREMAPDFSVRITEIAIPEHSAWLHFDAKYKVDTILELFGPAPEDKSGQARGEKSKVTPIGYKREDLLKMHAYKDAVRRSSGAFILYPGTENTIFRQFTEIVPGIGAFALRPTEMGPEGAPQVEQFLSDVISSFAAT